MRKIKRVVSGLFALTLCLTGAIEPMTLGAESASEDSSVVIVDESTLGEGTTKVTLGEGTTEVTLGEATEVIGEGEEIPSDVELWEDDPYDQLFWSLNTRTTVATDTNNYDPSVIGVTCTYKVGDVNFDGKVNSADVTSLKEYLLQGDSEESEAMDLNKDGRINSADVNFLKTRLLFGAEIESIKICLDAGHYGNTYNASTVPGYTTTYYESVMTWKLHKYLAEELESYGFQVVVTRADQNDKTLEARGQSSAGCDLFISLHSNAAGNDYQSAYDNYTGSIAICNYYATANTSKKELCDTSNAVGAVLVNASTDAIGLHGTLDPGCAALSTGNEEDGYIMHRTGSYSYTLGNSEWYGVLRGARGVDTPGILLENSYHTSTGGTEWLLDEENLKKLAKAEAKALADYYGYYK